MNHVQGTKIVQMLAPVAVTGGATVTASIDCIGFEYATLTVNLAVQTTPSMTALPVISVLESNDTVVTNHATIVADLGSIASSARQYVYHFDRRVPRKRFIRVTVTRVAAGTDGSGPVSINAVLGKATQAPASTSDMIGSTNDVVSLN